MKRIARTITGIGVIGLAALTGCDAMHAQRSWIEGQKAQVRNQLDAAQVYYQKCLEIDPSHWKCRYRLGRIALDAGDMDRAILHLEIAYEIAERNDARKLADVGDILAEAYYRDQNPAALITFLDLTVAQTGKPRDYLRKVTYLQRLGREDEVLMTCQAAAVAAPFDDAKAYNALADVCESMGAQDWSVYFLKCSFRANPLDPVTAKRLRRNGVVPGPTLYALQPGVPKRVHLRQELAAQRQREQQDAVVDPYPTEYTESETSTEYEYSETSEDTGVTPDSVSSVIEVPALPVDSQAQAWTADSSNQIVIPETTTTEPVQPLVAETPDPDEVDIFQGVGVLGPDSLPSEQPFTVETQPVATTEDQAPTPLKMRSGDTQPNESLSYDERLDEIERLLADPAVGR